MSEQLTVGALKQQLEELDDKLPVFFRRVAPVAGNIEGAYTVESSEFSFFGVRIPCIIIEPAKD